MAAVVALAGGLLVMPGAWAGVSTTTVGPLDGGPSDPAVLLIVPDEGAVTPRPTMPARSPDPLPPSPRRVETTPAPAPAPSAAEPPRPQAPARGLTVTSIAPLEFRPDGQVTIRGVIGGGAEALGDAQLEVLRTAERLDTRSAVDMWAADPGDGTLVEIATVGVGPVPADGGVALDATVPGDALRLRSTLSAAGPYGLVLRLRDAAAPTAPPVSENRGFAVWSPDILDDPLLVSPVLSFPSLAPDAATGLVDPALLESAAAPGGALRTSLDAASALPGSWSVDPLLVASADTEEAGPATRRWLSDLRRARAARAVLQQEWGTPDLDLLAGSDRTGELLGLLGETVLAATGGASGDMAPLVGGPVRTDITVVTGAASAEGLAVAASQGDAVVLPDTLLPLVNDTLPFTPDLRTDIATATGPVSLLVTDSSLSQSLAAAVDGDALSGTRFMADLAATALQRPSDRRILGLLLDDLDDASAPAAKDVSVTLTATPWAAGADIAEWLAVDPDPQSRVTPQALDPATADAAAAEVDELLRALTTLESLEDAVSVDADATSPHRRRTASAVAEDLVLVREVSGSLRATAGTWVQGARIVQGNTVTLAAEEATLTVTLVNDLDSDAELVLQARSRSARLRVLDSAIPVELPAGARTRVDLPVRAVSNGPASVSLRLLTPDTTPWGPAVETDVRVATVTEVGILGVAAAIAGTVFALGTWRTVRRRRRQSAAAQAQP